MKKYIALGCAIVLTIQFTGCDSIQKTLQEKKAIQEQKEREKMPFPKRNRLPSRNLRKSSLKLKFNPMVLRITTH